MGTHTATGIYAPAIFGIILAYWSGSSSAFLATSAEEVDHAMHLGPLSASHDGFGGAGGAWFFAPLFVREENENGFFLVPYKNSREDQGITLLRVSTRAGRPVEPVWTTQAPLFGLQPVLCHYRSTDQWDLIYPRYGPDSFSGAVLEIRSMADGTIVDALPMVASSLSGPLCVKGSSKPDSVIYHDGAALRRAEFSPHPDPILPPPLVPQWTNHTFRWNASIASTLSPAMVPWRPDAFVTNDGAELVVMSIDGEVLMRTRPQTGTSAQPARYVGSATFAPSPNEVFGVYGSGVAVIGAAGETRYFAEEAATGVGFTGDAEHLVMAYAVGSDEIVVVRDLDERTTQRFAVPHADARNPDHPPIPIQTSDGSAGVFLLPYRDCTFASLNPSSMQLAVIERRPRQNHDWLGQLHSPLVVSRVAGSIMAAVYCTFGNDPQGFELGAHFYRPAPNLRYSSVSIGKQESNICLVAEGLDRLAASDIATLSVQATARRENHADENSVHVSLQSLYAGEACTKLSTPPERSLWEIVINPDGTIPEWNYGDNVVPFEDFPKKTPFVGALTCVLGVVGAAFLQRRSGYRGPGSP